MTAQFETITVMSIYIYHSMRSLLTSHTRFQRKRSLSGNGLKDDHYVNIFNPYDFLENTATS